MQNPENCYISLHYGVRSPFVSRVSTTEAGFLAVFAVCNEVLSKKNGF
jgi:hypothetical protein